MSTFNAPLQSRLSLSSNYSATSRTRKVEFGDGYIQRTPLGINNHRRTLSVVYENITQSDYATVLAFYKAVLSTGDAVAFASNILMDSGIFAVESYDVQLGDNSVVTFSVSLTEVFDL